MMSLVTHVRLGDRNKKIAGRDQRAMSCVIQEKELGPKRGVLCWDQDIICGGL